MSLQEIVWSIDLICPPFVAVFNLASLKLSVMLLKVVPPSCWPSASSSSESNLMWLEDKLPKEETEGWEHKCFYICLSGSCPTKHPQVVKMLHKEPRCRRQLLERRQRSRLVRELSPVVEKALDVKGGVSCNWTSFHLSDNMFEFWGASWIIGPCLFTILWVFLSIIHY